MPARDVDYKMQLIDPMSKEPAVDVKGNPITLQHLMYESVTRPQQGDENIPAGDKMRLHSIAMKIADGKQLKATDLVKVKERSLKYLSVIAYGILCREISDALGEDQEKAD